MIFAPLKQQPVVLLSEQLCLVDKGYQGLAKYHAHSCIPTKKPRKAELPELERHHNRLLARLQVRVEHSMRRLKIFHILAERYRIELCSAEGVRRKRFGL